MTAQLHQVERRNRRLDQRRSAGRSDARYGPGLHQRHLRTAPQADLVFDRFHIEHHLTDAGDQVRKAEFWRKSGPHREAIRGKKFLLLEKRRRLHWRRRRELDELFRLNRLLQVAYMLKEQFDIV